MKKIYFLFLMCFIVVITKAQIAYDFAASTGTYTNLVGGISPVFDAALTDGTPESDEGYANNQPIGFTFNYNGNAYTQFHINTNGFISLGIAMTPSNAYWSNTTGLASGPINGSADNKSATRPVLAALWDDLDFASTGNITYSTTGTAPNRILTVQFIQAKWRYTATAASVSFQIKVYETGNVEFVYKPETGATGTPTASVGITASGIGADNYISVSGLTDAATSSKTVETNNISAKPTNGLTFTFSPAALPAQDASVLGYASVPFTGCHNTPQTVVVRVKNSGSAIIATGGIALNLSSTGANSVNLNSFNASDIAVGATQDITFSAVGLNTAGATVLRSVVTLTGDPNSSNDTGRITLTTATTTSTFPITEGAEMAPYSFGLVRAFAGGNGWFLSPGFYNYPDAAATDSLGPKSGANSFLFDAYNSPNGTRTLLYTNCLSIPATTPGFQYDMSFWMGHDTGYITNADSIYVNVSTTRGQSWTRIGGFRRHDPAFAVPGWKKERVMLTAYAGQTIMLGFEGVSQFGNGILIDDIEVRSNAGLPVTLSFFSGTKEANNNILQWQTASEINNKGFELMRSADGKNFSPIVYIASQAKDGASNNNIDYKFIDEKSLSGNNYYQLKQIDKDGKITFSNVVLLKGKLVKNIEISSLFPNPTTHVLNAIVSSDREEKVTLSITDLAGKVINQQIIKLNQGSNNLQFNTQALTRGSYLLRLNSTNSNETMVQKFVKQ